jgi:hypothetical protein
MQAALHVCLKVPAIRQAPVGIPRARKVHKIEQRSRGVTLPAVCSSVWQKYAVGADHAPHSVVRTSMGPIGWRTCPDQQQRWCRAGEMKAVGGSWDVANSGGRRGESAALAMLAGLQGPGCKALAPFKLNTKQQAKLCPLAGLGLGQG